MQIRLLLACYAWLFMSLALPTPPAELKLEVDLGVGNFHVGSPIAVSFTVKNRQGAPVEGTLMATVATLNRKAIAGYEKHITLAPQKQQEVHLTGEASELGVYLLYVRFTQKDSKTRLLSKTYIVGYGLHNLDSKITRPADFKTFWAAAKTQLAKVAPQYKLTKLPAPAHGLYQAYSLEMKSADNYTIKGIYRVPTKGTKFPVMLQLPSLGGMFIDAPSLGENAYRGTPMDFAVLALNIRAHGKSDSPFVVKDYHELITHGLADKDTYFYKGALLDCMRAIDFLASRPEIDGDKIGVEGMSQGGGLSLLLAGLDKRINICAPDVPFLCDVDKLLEDASWASDQLKRYQKATPNTTIWGLQQNFRYFDTKNIADLIACPVVMSVGLQDWTCPPHTCYATYNKIKSTKEIFLYVHGAHEGGGKAHRKLKFEWIRERWGMK